MKYLCVEDNIPVSILDYLPNVPESVKIIEISDLEAENLNQGKMYYDQNDKKVKAVKKETLDSIDLSNESLSYLNSTDWMILRHIRERALGIETSLSEHDYLELEESRHEAASKIIKRQ